MSADSRLERFIHADKMLGGLFCTSILFCVPFAFYVCSRRPVSTGDFRLCSPYRQFRCRRCSSAARTVSVVSRDECTMHMRHSTTMLAIFLLFYRFNIIFVADIIGSLSLAIYIVGVWNGLWRSDNGAAHQNTSIERSLVNFVQRRSCVDGQTSTLPFARVCVSGAAMTAFVLICIHSHESVGLPVNSDGN